MANITPSFVMVHPSFVEPGVILPYTQVSGAFETLANGEPLVRLGEGDLYVYMKRMDIRTKVAAGQTAYNQLPGISITNSMISTPSYMMRCRAEYDHHDTAAAGQWGYDITAANRLGMRLAHFQFLRNALLYGFQPANGEGLVNAVGATSTALPADSYNNQTLVTYDNGQLGMFFLTVISALKTRCNQLGIPRRFVILGPQRVMAAMEYQNIVQLTTFQRPGAGSDTTKGMIQQVAEGMNGDEIIWAYDDTLIGKGLNNGNATDAIIVVMPEVQKPVGAKYNTNEFARLAPGIEACTLMYTDMAAPREIPTPLAGGAIDVLSEWRGTSGWVVRPEAITIVSMQYQ
jgi:hypothetical protein